MRTQRTYFERLDREFQVINGTGRRRKVEYRVNSIFDVDVIGYVVVNEGKISISGKVGNVSRITRDKIIHCDDGVSLCQKAVTQMGTQKPGTARDKYAQVKPLCEMQSRSKSQFTTTSSKG